MYLRGNSIGTDDDDDDDDDNGRGRRTTDDGRHTLNLSFYRTAPIFTSNIDNNSLGDATTKTKVLVPPLKPVTFFLFAQQPHQVN